MAACVEVGPARPPAIKAMHLSSYMWFVEGLLGAAANLETSFEKPAAWKCCLTASMHEDGMASRQRWNLAGPDGSADTVDGLHTSESDVEAMVGMAKCGLSE